MRRLIIAIELELLAVLLAVLRCLGGVLTDEAKYLLDIPYPHPPLMRGILNALTALPGHELLIRIVSASMLVQALWLIRCALRHERPKIRAAVCALWLGSAAVILQAGTIMMAPVTGVFGLILVAVFLREKETKETKEWLAFVIAMGWFASLFIAYQAVLYVPLMIGVLHTLRIDRRKIAAYVLGPLLPLVVYSLSNPLSLGSMLLVNGGDSSLADRIGGVVWIWWLAGSGIVSILGVWGAIHARRWEMLATLALLFAYICLTPHEYYAILLTPVLLAGVVEWLRRTPDIWKRSVMVPGVALCALWVLGVSTTIDPLTAWTTRNIARDTVRIASADSAMRLLIAGPFGHAWQYYWPGNIIRYTPSLKDKAADGALVVCLTTCPVALGTGNLLTMPVY